MAVPTDTPLPGSYYYSGASGCDNSSFVKDVTIPDGTVLAPGQEFTKTWKLENTGSCAWNSNYSLVFVSGYEMHGGTTYLDRSVGLGKKADVSVGLTAPDADGTYYGYWMLADDSGYTFGATVYVEIVVSDTITATPTPSSTPTASPTPTGTPTSSPSATPTLTAVPSATPTPTGSPTATPTTSASPTSTAADTATATPTLVPTATPTASASPTGTAADTGTPTPTRVPTASPTSTH